MEVQRGRTRLLTLTSTAQVINRSLKVLTAPGAAEMGKVRFYGVSALRKQFSSHVLAAQRLDKENGARRPVSGAAAVTRACTDERLHRGEKPAGRCQAFQRVT